jgi:hypothetical protein
MITDLDETIKQILIKKGQIDPAAVDIRFETPKREWSASLSRPTINFYLYDIRENHELRGTEWFVNKDDKGMATRRKNASRFNLSYLITVWTNNVDDEHRLLWQVLQTLFRHPVIPEELLNGQLAAPEYPIETKTAQPDGLFGSPSDFWAALDNEIKPSVNYVVTLPLDVGISFTAGIATGAEVRMEQMDVITSQPARVSGKVHEAGKPDKVIPGAKIVAREARLATRTDATGRYLFTALTPGKHTLHIMAKGRKIKEIVLLVPGTSYDIEV